MVDRLLAHIVRRHHWEWWVGAPVLPRGAAWDESFHRQADARLWTGSAPSSAPSSLLIVRGRTDRCNLRLPVSCGVLHF